MSSVKTSKFVYRSTAGGAGDLSIEYGTDLGAFTRLEDKIRLLQEDLESERELRQRIERERSDLTVQLMQISERLEEAEGSSESQLEMNKKRDLELSKLRKLLDDVHLESEENAHHLRKKHQEAIVELQDQLDQANKSKAKIEREKQKFQAEVYDLLSQVELANKDKVAAQKTVERLEITIHDLNIHIEELNRQVTEISSQRSRLSSENTELMKEVQEYKLHLDNANHLKGQLAVQLEEIRRRLEDEERRRSALEQHNHTLEVEVESLKTQLDEESEARIDLERQLSKANGEAATWKSKYEAECTAHADEVDELRRRLAQKTAEYEEQLQALLNKCSALEKHKSRLQSEVEVLIMDLEKATTHAQNLEKRVSQLEKVNHDLKSKVDELIALLEAAQRDFRAKVAELQKLQHDFDKLKDLKEALARENKKLADDLGDCKAQLSDATRRIHEMDLEIKRLETEREELSAAYREAESLRKQEEAKAQRLAQELAQMRHDYEKRLAAKEEELEALRVVLRPTDCPGMELDVHHTKHVREMEARRREEDTQRLLQQPVEVRLVGPSDDVIVKAARNDVIIVNPSAEHLSREERKQYQIEVDQLNMRLAEAEAKLKSEVARIKKKMQVQITELEMSLDVANKQNLDLQKTIKKQALQMQELQSHYDEVTRQLQQAIDQLGVAQRRVQTLQMELDEMRSTVEQAQRGKRQAEQMYEEAHSKVNELTTINVNLSAAKNKLESDFTTLQSDYEEVSKELRVVDEKYNRTIIELKTIKDQLTEEQERCVKIESIKKSLEMEVHNLQVRIEEVEANALAGGRRVISKLEARIKDVEIEMEEEKRRHSETQKSMRKKENRLRELMLQTEDDHKTITMLNDAVEKLSEKVKLYKRQLDETEGISQQNLSRVRRFQRELEAAEDRAEAAESNLSMIRAKHRSWVTTNQVPGGVRQVFVTEETTTSNY
ncbi:Paramyosin like protein [Argiope bruennichi]|uniref:Paramyosin like protein n=1 Tax=Argiope bruennichi TaxID=94029 RepID=A0A8T0EM65_ARGBR|nr:Paramyosin like protein [Argiope bruennichi]